MMHLFISDLHLSPEHPRLIRGFLDFLKHYQKQHVHLYILGDWFDAWIGDDDQAAWLDEIVIAMQDFHRSGNRIYFQVGNRDFALGQNFLDQFNGILLPEVAYLKVGQYNYRIEHGDALCTDDLSYQRFKKIIRQPLILALLKRTPLNFRKKLAAGFRQKSTTAQQYKTADIMDVNDKAVEQAIHNVDVLIHGHTHRPNTHSLQDKTRIVLGDWREQSAEAKYLKIDHNGHWQLLTWVIA
ncbi:UDP-2,3-diacylglucosamine diphosphatase [Acinetobacter larvae]|uniref:UDP-2,3-diacylglucosamine hydrolase n=1 Tax=Acinetobacter larvae TaxID=1789224 RepID=A0A1B2LYL8_9GAMM|nr:UDP-2,3-diacylglucosamine diphosphatase [Acinetobacter larvae]AOA57979.1 UDP-2,3-diacylglucosamine diphosphatase [Acinetobacter larvae]